MESKKILLLDDVVSDEYANNVEAWLSEEGHTVTRYSSEGFLAEHQINPHIFRELAPDLVIIDESQHAGLDTVVASARAVVKEIRHDPMMHTSVMTYYDNDSKAPSRQITHALEHMPHLRYAHFPRENQYVFNNNSEYFKQNVKALLKEKVLIIDYKRTKSADILENLMSEHGYSVSFTTYTDFKGLIDANQPDLVVFHAEENEIGPPRELVRKIKDEYLLSNGQINKPSFAAYSKDQSHKVTDAFMPMLREIPNYQFVYFGALGLFSEHGKKSIMERIVKA